MTPLHHGGKKFFPSYRNLVGSSSSLRGMTFSSRSRQRSFLPALCLLFVLVSGGLYPSAAHAASSEERTASGFELVEPMREGTYEAEYSTIAEDGALEEKSGEFEADFGTIEVPENRRDPDTRTIRLPIVRIHATGERPAEPIFWFAVQPKTARRI